MQNVDSKKPAFIGGAIVGLLSVIPIVQAANICFCLWALVGGVVAAKLLVNASPVPVEAREGARIGLLAGLVGAVIYVLIETPITIWRMDEILSTAGTLPMATDEAREVFARLQQNSAAKPALAFVFAFISAVFLLGFTVVGGLLGVALFEKRKGQVPPQYPPQYPANDPANYPPPH
jgi:hypothetical protein